jgi:SpoVK/Ycf46/Vps4 family AAA+-type ATPase
VVWNHHTGVEALITVMAATNEPQAIDLGFLRPGRLDRVIFVGKYDNLRVLLILI